MTELKIDNQQSIHSKLHKIQTEIGGLFRTEENKFQRYKYFNEKQCLELLKPLLEKYKIALYFSDEILMDKKGDDTFFNENSATNMIFQETKSGWLVKYLKRVELINIVDYMTPRDVINNASKDFVDYKIKEEKVIFNFWAIGMNIDPAKAKGSAETYALKYFFNKFFLIPVSDENDPDKAQETLEQNKKVAEQVLNRHGWNREIKTEINK